MPRLGRSRPASAYLFIGRKPQPQGTAHTATASLTVTPSFSAGRVRGKYRTGALTVTPSFAAAGVRGKYRTGSLAVSPSFSAARLQNHVRAGSLIVAPSFSAALDNVAFQRQRRKLPQGSLSALAALSKEDIKL